MNFRLKNNGAVLSESEFRGLHGDKMLPSVLTTADLDLLGADVVLPAPAPTVTPFQEVQRNGAVKDGNDNWVQSYLVVDWSQARIDAYIAALKIEKNLQINQSRQSANFTSFPYAGKTIACDALSRSDIDATNAQVMRLNAMPPNWPGGWKAIDNTIIPISTVSQWNAFYDAMYQQGLVNFSRAQTLKGTLAAATTEAQINSITW